MTQRRWVSAISPPASMPGCGGPFSPTQHSALAVSSFVVSWPGGQRICFWRRRRKRRKTPPNLDRRAGKSMMLSHIHSLQKAKKGQSRGDDMLSDTVGGRICAGQNRNLVLQVCKKVVLHTLHMSSRVFQTERMGDHEMASFKPPLWI